MYTLYFLPGACSLATQAILYELDQPVELIEKSHAEEFELINPVATVPVLIDGEKILTEGAAIALYLLAKHENNLIAAEGAEREKDIEHILFANATVHPAYSKLFFIERVVTDAGTKQQAFAAAASAINLLWRVVEAKLGQNTYLSGERVSAADFLLATYSRWGQFFRAGIVIGPNAQRMIDAVIARPSFQKALARESEYAARVA